MRKNIIYIELKKKNLVLQRWQQFTTNVEKDKN